jgi:cardiolipin synthase
VPQYGNKHKVRLLIQPGAGVEPLTKAIAGAKKRIEIVIFRFDRSEIERALGNAVARRVAVHALIAHTNRAGEENLRGLEMRLLGMGVSVARTAGDLIRYHSKFMIIDRRELWVLAFNPTYADMERSRSFAVVTTNRAMVREAVRLFEADTKRQPYESQYDRFVVSPLNSRKQLGAFIAGAKKELIIYDPKVSDRAILRLLEQRAEAGVNVRVIGRVAGKARGVAARRLANMRLHTRTMVRDGKLAFMGSQSLREEELDARREVGIIFSAPDVARSLVETFEADWAAGETAIEQDAAAPTSKMAKKIAKAVAKEISPVTPLLNGAVKQAVNLAEGEEISAAVEQMVKDAVKDVVKEAVRDAVEEAVKKSGVGAE